MPKKRVTLESLLSHKRGEDYESQCRYIQRLEKEGKILPVKASGVNGKKPSLYLAYWKITEEKDYSGLLSEIRFGLSPYLHNDYYLRHPEVYEKEREDVRLLDRALLAAEGKFAPSITINERSYAIWHREKFLLSGGGKALLTHCGLTLDDLGVIRTAEPFATFCRSRDVPQNVVILENKDPFYSMRRYLLMGNTKVLGIPTGTLIYGAGKRVVSTFADFSLSAESYLMDPANRFLYFGDLDYEGIGIYEGLCQGMKESFPISPMKEAYLAMIDKAKEQGFDTLPLSKEGQNRNISSFFFSFFEKEDAEKMKRILESGRYIPQEILNILDY